MTDQQDDEPLDLDSLEQECLHYVDIYYKIGLRLIARLRQAEAERDAARAQLRQRTRPNTGAAFMEALEEARKAFEPAAEQLRERITADLDEAIAADARKEPR